MIMQTITFEQIAARVAAFHAAENAPAAVACRAVEALRAALDACAPTERREILALVADLGSGVRFMPVVRGLRCHEISRSCEPPRLQGE